MAIEIERKYLEVNLVELAARLRSLGAISGGRHFEENLLLDTENGELLRQGQLLRLRRQEWPDKKSYKLTFKRPLPGAGSKTKAEFSEPVKKNEELELEIGSFEEARRVFACLGYKPWCAYEKVREGFRLPLVVAAGSPPAYVEVDLDLLSFMNAAEIEGDEAQIDIAQKLLGLDNFKKSSTNYHKLHQEWRKAAGLSESPDFVFPPEEKTRLRKELGLE